MTVTSIARNKVQTARLLCSDGSLQAKLLVWYSEFAPVQEPARVLQFVSEARDRECKGVWKGVAGRELERSWPMAAAAYSDQVRILHRSILDDPELLHIGQEQRQWLWDNLAHCGSGQSGLVQ